MENMWGGVLKMVSYSNGLLLDDQSVELAPELELPN
jgi:hypothetical protein